jgi:hypothetical protein
MALLRAAGLCRFALRTPWAAVRLLSSAAGGELPAQRQVALEALRRERALRPPADRLPAALPVTASLQTGFAARSSYEQRQLNKSLATCATVDEVLDLVAARMAIVDCVTVSTTLLVIARLTGKREPALWLKDDKRFRQLMRSALSLIERQEMDAQGFSNMLYACGQLGIVPPKSWLLVFWDRSTAVIGNFKPQELSNTIYACGQLAVVPPPEWLQRYWHASAAKVGVFTPQALSNTLYACGQLSITPPADWLPRFWHASAAALGDFNPQNLSNTLYASGQLGITPPDYWLERFWHASSARLSQFDPQALSNTLYACGQLSIMPADYWLPRFSHAFDERSPNMNLQDLSNTAVALAMLQLWELPLWRGLWERLCSTLPDDIFGWSAVNRLQARQLYQAYQTAAVERPGLLPEPSPELLAAARKSWVDGLDTDTDLSSKLHGDVSECLMRMGVAHANEHWCERTERTIDIAIEGATPIALEVDGPFHFLLNGRQDGSTLLRNRMLAANGWRVVPVDDRAWDVLQTQEQREEFLRRLLCMK